MKILVILLCKKENCLSYLRKWYDVEDSGLLEHEVLPFETLGSKHAMAQRQGVKERNLHPNRRKKLETRIES
jgi:hypothetical protein